jgi:signal transduction histidine kinase
MPRLKRHLGAGKAAKDRPALKARKARQRPPQGSANPLLQANEALVLSVLRTQDEIEETQRASNERETAAELRLQAQRLSEENRQLVETARLKNQFIAMMSHELRTPLNAILGFSELLRTGPQFANTAQSLNYLDLIHDSGEHLLNIVNSTLDIAKGAAGRLDFQPERLALQPLVTEVVQMLHGQSERKQLHISVQLGDGLDHLWLDRTRLKQVLANYLSNAIKFSDPGSTVTLRAERLADDSFRLEVQDTGIGIAAADQPRLFREFQQLNVGLARSHDGSGLGLALTRMLVQAQGGSVGLHSRPGLGSTFHAVLPCTDSAHGPPA